MSTIKTEVQPVQFQQIVQQVDDALREAKARIAGEIRAYPPPIPACDAQFNYLLEQRNAVAAELSAVRDIAASEQAARKQLAALVATSSVLKADAKQRLLARLSE